MTHKVAKLMLEHAGTAIDREKAIEAAMQMGMPLIEIEEYLDWIDAVKYQSGQSDDRGSVPKDTCATGDNRRDLNDDPQSSIPESDRSN